MIMPMIKLLVVVFSLIFSPLVSTDPNDYGDGGQLQTILARHRRQSPTINNRTGRSTPDDVNILPTNYYRNVAPVKDGHPVIVKISVVILNLKIGSLSTQDFDVDIFYHSIWEDYRLQKPTNADAITQKSFKSASNESMIQYRLSDSWSSRLWIPNVYFRNAISGSISKILTPTYYFTITNYTEVFMAVRLSLKLTCHMNFYKFPFDTQTCYLNLTSTSEDMNTMVMKWKTFRIGSHVDESEFTITDVDKVDDCFKQYEFGKFSCLYGKIVFKRNVGKYLIKRLIPSFIIVSITFIGFWIPTNISPARTALPITALLALITQQIQSDLNVSYVYALQVWNIVCIVFVFANLLEFAVALYIMHRDQQAVKQREMDAKKNDLATGLSPDDNDPDGTRWNHFKRRLSIHCQTNSRHSSIDIVSRYVFPMLYLIFILLFTAFVLTER